MNAIRRRGLIALSLLLIAILAGVLVTHRKAGPVRHEFVTQQPGEAPHVWRSFRTVWTFSTGFPNHHANVNDLCLRQDRLYYICDYEAGCLDKASGQTLWQNRFVTQKIVESEAYSSTGTWHLSDDSHHLYACQCVDNASSESPPFTLRALDLNTGKTVWERSFATAPQAAPYPSGDLLLVPCVDGTLMGLRSDNGAIVWQRKLTLKKYDPQGSNPYLELRAEAGIGVAQIGAGRLLGFRLEDGKPLWDIHTDDWKLEEAEEGGSSGFVLKDGVVYALLDNHEQVALQAATGKRLWHRVTEGGVSQSSQVLLWSDIVLTLPSDTLTALRRTNGTTLWHHENGNIDNVHIVETSPTDRFPKSLPDTYRQNLFAVIPSAPLLDKMPRSLRSVSDLDTVIALDPTTGKEQWRWQPEYGSSIVHLTPDDRCLYLVDGFHIRAVEDGLPDPLPTAKDARRRLVQRMVFALFQWPQPQPNLLQRLGKKVPAVASQLSRTEEESVDPTEANLTLLRLGKDSVPVLLDYIAYQIREADGVASTSQSLWQYRSSNLVLERVFDLLLDINDPTVVPTLIHHLDSAKDPASRFTLAEALIRFGDLSALPALYRYAQTAGEDSAQQDALYFICRYAPATARAPSDSPTQSQVTAYLMAHLNDPKAPYWLRQFSRFELLNDRGDTARRAALATFHRERTASLFPEKVVLRGLSLKDIEIGRVSQKGFPDDFIVEADCQDEEGRWWAVFSSDYLGTSDHYWIVQSNDRKHWVKPALSFDFSTDHTPPGNQGSLRLACHAGRLRLMWTETRKVPAKVGKPTFQTVPRHTEIAIADLYRDSDHDGLPDLLEKVIGTNPFVADTNGNGLRDGDDKNPLCMPHRLTDEEGIYQAVVEALCQYGRAIPAEKRKNSALDDTAPFGSDSHPLRLVLPQGSAGIEITGHEGVILPSRFRTLHEAWNRTFYRFVHPHIGLDGLWDKQEQRRQERKIQTDPFAPSVVSKQTMPSTTFHDDFPYQLSTDGNRARVGWNDFGWREFDIEVRKIGERWIPVECRLVALNGRHSEWVTATPLHTIPHAPESRFLNDKNR